MSQTQIQIPESQTHTQTHTKQEREIDVIWNFTGYNIMKYTEVLMRLAKNDKIPKSLIEDVAKLSNAGLLIAVVRHSKRQELYTNLEKIYNYFKKEFNYARIYEIVEANIDKFSFDNFITGRRKRYNIVNLFEYDYYNRYTGKTRIYCGIVVWGYNIDIDNKKVQRIVFEAGCCPRRLDLLTVMTR